MYSQSLIATSSQIGAMIRKRRRELAFSQETIAAGLNVSNQQVQRYESGMDRISIEKLQTTAHLLAVPMTYFFPQKNVDTIVAETDIERELLLNFRKIQSMMSKKLVLEVLLKAAYLEEMGAEI